MLLTVRFFLLFLYFYWWTRHPPSLPPTHTYALPRGTILQEFGVRIFQSIEKVERKHGAHAETPDPAGASPSSSAGAEPGATTIAAAAVTMVHSADATAFYPPISVGFDCESYPNDTFIDFGCESYPAVWTREWTNNFDTWIRREMRSKMFLQSVITCDLMMLLTGCSNLGTELGATAFTLNMKWPTAVLFFIQWLWLKY